MSVADLQREIAADRQTIAFLEHSVEWNQRKRAVELVYHLRLAADRMHRNLERNVKQLQQQETISHA